MTNQYGVLAEVTLTEKAFTAQVREMLALAGFDCIYHTHDSRHSPAGFPDIVALRERGSVSTLVVIELKTERGRVTEPQQRWLDAWAVFADGLPTGRVIHGVYQPSDRERLWEELTA